MMKRSFIWLGLALLTALGCQKEDVAPKILEGEVLRAPIEVSLDPYGRAPLSALAVVRTHRPSTVTVMDAAAEETRYVSPAADTLHELPVLGLYPDSLNRLEIEVTDEAGNRTIEVVEVQTEPLPSFLPQIQIVENQSAGKAPGFTFCDFAAGNDGLYLSYPFAFDEQGAIRWALDLGFTGRLTIPLQRLKNGNFIVGRVRTIYEFDLLGKEVNQWILPGFRQHHDLIEKEDGNLIVAVDKDGLETLEDHIIELGRTSGAVIREWDLRQLLDTDRFDLVHNSNDWLHTNAVWYQEEEDALVVSGRNQGVVKVSGDNELIWILAPHKGWGKAGIDGTGPETAPFLLDAVNEQGVPYPEEVQQGLAAAPDFDWPWGQHAPMYLPNGNLLLFDNGFMRQFGQAGSGYSRAVEYEIDEALGTVRQVWQYGKERGEEMFSNIISDVDYLEAEGNILITAGIINPAGAPHARIIELHYPNKNVLFEAELHFKNELGSGEFSWGQFDICYRAEKLGLY